MKQILVGLSMLILASCGNGNSNTGNSNFKWDFSKQRKFVYTFSQTVNAVNTMGKGAPTNKTFMTGMGHLNVRVKENHMADLSLTDVDMRMVRYDENGVPSDTIKQKIPANVVQDMKPDGSLGGTHTNIMFDLIFPLPNKALEKGDSDIVLVQMPFNANGSRLFSKGHNKLTYIKQEEAEGIKCVVLNGEIDISKLDVPEELKGTYGCVVTGNATYYFDLVHGFYVGADIFMITEIEIDNENEAQGGLGMFVKMKSDHLYKVRLKDIEE